jgi:hypothetical protein
VCDDMTNVLQKGMQPPSDVVDKQESSYAQQLQSSGSWSLGTAVLQSEARTGNGPFSAAAAGPGEDSGDAESHGNEVC